MPIVDSEEEVLPIKIRETWMMPIFCYLDQGMFLEDQLKAKKLYKDQQDTVYSMDSYTDSLTSNHG